jgi:hypothetical protein
MYSIRQIIISSKIILKANLSISFLLPIIPVLSIGNFYYCIVQEKEKTVSFQINDLLDLIKEYRNQLDCGNLGSPYRERIKTAQVLRLFLYRCIGLRLKGRVGQIFRIIWHSVDGSCKWSSALLKRRKKLCKNLCKKKNYNFKRYSNGSNATLTLS